MKELFSKVAEYREQIQLSIKYDNEVKHDPDSYPGYWLYLAGERLPERSYKRLLATLELDAATVNGFKVMFALDMYAQLKDIQA